MKAAMSDVTVHVDESLNDRELFNLEQAIRGDFGIISVGHSHVNRHLLLVLYDPEMIKGRDILRRVMNQGFHGELIGF